MKIAVAAALALLLTGCAALKSPDELAEDTTETLALDYFLGPGREKIENELRRRNAFTDAEWTMIKSRRVFLGASPHAVIAAKGTATTRGGHFAAGVNIRSWYYRDGPLITFENDLVTSITW